MKFKILFFSLSIILANDNIQLNSLLFCIKENVDNIVISNNNNTIKTNYESIDVILNELNNPKIERWLPGATDKDYSNGIYLNKIFRLNFSSYENIKEITKSVASTRKKYCLESEKKINRNGAFN